MINLKYLLSSSSCGHFCIQFILKKYKIKNNFKYNKKYMSLYEIKTILEKYNFSCLAYKINDLKKLDKEKMVLSLIQYSNFFHYIVIIRYNEKYVYYYNPLYLFKIKLPIERFKKNWSNICLVFDYSLNNQN